MKNNSIKGLALILALIGGAAQAQWHVEGSYAPTTFNYTDGGSSKPAMLSGIVGYQVHPNLAIEGFMGKGIKDGSYNSVSNPSINEKINEAYGLYVRPSYALNEQLELFARLGTLTMKHTASEITGGVANGRVYPSTEHSMSWALGGSYAVEKKTYVTVGYNSYYNKNGGKITGLNVGMGYRF